MKKIRLFFLALIFMVLLSGCDIGKKNLSVSPYILTKVSGLSGRADAKVYLDTEGIYIALAGAEASPEQRAVYDPFVNSLNISVDKLSKLANGDKMIVTVTYDHEIADGLKINVDDFIKAVEVKDLVVGQEIDLFKDLEVRVFGIIPYATLTVTNNSVDPYISSLNYRIVSDTSDIRNGDVITVACDYDAAAAEKYNYYTDITQMKFTVEGLDQYIYSTALLDVDAMSEIASECAKTIVDETRDTTTRMLYKLTGSLDYLYQDNHERVDELVLNQVIFLSANTRNTTTYENVILYVFKATVANNNYSSEGFYIFRYTNAIYGGDGGFYIGRNNPELRYVCGLEFDGLYNEILAGEQPLYDACLVEGVEFSLE